jgi:hypothetical protein
MKITDVKTFTKYEAQWFQNYITLRQLAFIRAMDKQDLHAANIACAQKDWAEKELTKIVGQSALSI